MEKVVKFTNQDEALKFCAANPDYKPMCVFSRNFDKPYNPEKIYIAYNTKLTLKPNAAVLEYWEREGLI